MKNKNLINWDRYTKFQKKVFRLVKNIPSGKFLTYGQVAKKLGNPKLARAVGGALKMNKDAPVIPCHRVIGYNSIGGYSAIGGVKAKLRLLKREGIKLDFSI